MRRSITWLKWRAGAGVKPAGQGMLSSRRGPETEACDGNHSGAVPAKSLKGRLLAAGASDYPELGFEDEVAAREALRMVDAHTMCSYERLVTLWQQVRYLDRAGIDGALVECGTWRGGACGMMALAHLASGRVRRMLHLFDSFEGLPEPDAEKDGERSVSYASGRASGVLKSIGACVGSQEDCRALLEKCIGYPVHLTHYHRGWFQDTVGAAAVQIGSIALLRLDGDWYESTRVCVEQLVPQVVRGGIVVVDDYGHWQGCRAAVDEFLSHLPNPVLLHRIDGTARYFVVQE